jgi:superoxide dismutase, Cu-Zn family
MKNIYKQCILVASSTIITTILVIVFISKIKDNNYITSIMTSNNSKIEAIAVLNNKEQKVQGTVKFIEQNKQVKIEVNLKGLTPGLHGFHIHETGNLLDKCSSCKAHFNPYNKNHGGPNSKERHVGDLGNIVANSKGVVNQVLYDSLIKLRGTKCNIIGRSVVIHQDEDNLGVPGDPESLKTGRAGSRVGCAVIGYTNAYYF